MGKGSSTRQTKERTPEFRGPLAAKGGRRCRLAGRDSLWEVDDLHTANQQQGHPEGVLVLHSPKWEGHATTVTHSGDKKRRPGPQALLLSTPNNQHKEVDGHTLLRLDADDFSPSTPSGRDTR